MAIVTISRLTGSGGREIATATAQALNFQFIDRNAMDVAIDQQFPVRTERLSRIKKDRRVYDEMVRSAIAELAASHNVVILGSGAQFLFAKVAASLHIQIVAPLPYRIAQVMRLARVDRVAAECVRKQVGRDQGRGQSEEPEPHARFTVLSPKKPVGRTMTATAKTRKVTRSE